MCSALCLAIIYPACLPALCAATIAGSAQLPEDKRKYTFEVFYNQWMYGINQACLRTGAFDLLEQFRAGKYE